MAMFAGPDYGVTNTKIGPWYESFIRAFEAAGHQVAYTAHRQCNFVDWPDVIQEDVVVGLKEFNPDICIIFNFAFWDLSEIVDCPILIYASDSYLYWPNLSKIKAHPDRYFFCVSEDSVEYLRKIGVKDYQIGECHPFSMITPEEKEKKSNIVYIASKFMNYSNRLTHTEVNSFLSTNPTDEERNEFRLAIRYFKKHPYSEVHDLIRQNIIRSEKVINHFFPAALRMELSDENRIGILAEVADLGLDLYGSGNWATDYYYQTELMLCYSNQIVKSFKENMDAYNSSKIGICIGHIQAVNGFPWRVLDILNSSACLVSDYHKDYDKCFPKDLFPVFNNKYEARELCKKVLADESWRKHMVLRCNEYVQTHFSFRKILDEISELTGVDL
ncbi:hypothetical protein D081_1087 [Anaerovibrio sp. JC8]|nr:hypothetical protein D081_1087 [Anaerovibrio sp. JC8]